MQPSSNSVVEMSWQIRQNRTNLSIYSAASFDGRVCELKPSQTRTYKCKSTVWVKGTPKEKQSKNKNAKEENPLLI